MEMLSAEGFRQRLAGLVDPSRKMPEMEEKVVRDEAIKFCSTLPKLFSDDFDRKTLWERIGNGIVSAVKKCSGDYEEFVNLALEFIKAEPGKVASCEELGLFLNSMELKPPEWKKQFLYLMEKKHNIVLVYARQHWNAQKKGGIL
jgi:hypothetical protein